MKNAKGDTDTTSPGISRRGFLGVVLASGCAHVSPGRRFNRTSLVGYTEYRTNLPTRFDNQVTSRACIVGADGTGRRMLVEELTAEPNSWTQFAGWSPDGRIAIIGRGWESPENAAWEEANKTFRMTEGWLFDIYFLDIEAGGLTNITEVERVSAYNGGVFFLPDGKKLGFTALINGVSHPFIMDLDGKNKVDLNQGKDGFAYGFSASPDGGKVAYHKDYQIYIAEADGSNPRLVETGNPFNFVPQWSPDGAMILFVSGEHYNCHPHVVNVDGTGLRKLADRGGYTGVTTVYDVYDFHGGSSDVPVWDAAGHGIYYTAKVDEAVELFHMAVDGEPRQLTHAGGKATHYHPKPTPDGEHLVFGSDFSGTRQLYIMPADGGDASALTRVPTGSGAMWAHWRPQV
ncbi:MAG: hypothetical protein AMXMBFR84_32510 [Candidatus Hydrogenedentota bacterium]